jgi:ribosomal protein S27AE
MNKKGLEELIRIRAFELYEFYRDEGYPDDPLRNYLQAEAELADNRQTRGCPKCGFKILGGHDDKIICLRNNCDWQIDSKRFADRNIPKISELKNNWQ